jgi:hypothetical protein
MVIPKILRGTQSQADEPALSLLMSIKVTGDVSLDGLNTDRGGPLARNNGRRKFKTSNSVMVERLNIRASKVGLD